MLSTHERIPKFQALGTNKQVPLSSICKYNLLQKAKAWKSLSSRESK